MAQFSLVRLLQRTIMYVLVVMAIVGVSMSAVAAQPPRGGTRPMVAYEFTSISAGIQHTCALTSVGTIYCWGDNANGQLGIGSLVSKSTPTLVKQPTGVTFRTVSASGNHTCALSTINKAYCWGSNSSGQLGNGTTTNSNVPAAVSTPAGVTFTRLQIGWAHTCALTNTNVAYCWGNNDYGNVGNGQSDLRFTIPMRVSMPTGIAFATITAGQYHSCAMTTNKKAYCWGTNIFGALGSWPPDAKRNKPVAVGNVLIGDDGGMSGLSAGGQFSCAMTHNKTVYCWGLNDRGQIGFVGSNVYSPEQVTGISGADMLSAGGKHACVLVAAAPYCWGSNTAGQLGKGDLVDSSDVVAVTIPSGVTFTSISAGMEHTCALTTTYEVYCWGRNANGQLGDGTTTNRTTPIAAVMPQVPTSTPTLTFTRTRTGTRTFTPSNTATASRTGTATRTATATFTPSRTLTPSRTRTFTATRTFTKTQTFTKTSTFTVTRTFTRTFTPSRTSTPTSTNTPTMTYTATDTATPTNTATATHTATASRTATPTFTTGPTAEVVNYGQLSVGTNGYSTCALNATGKAYCWGGTIIDVDGNMTEVLRPTLVDMPAGITFTKISNGGVTACAIATNGHMYCWGDNYSGQLGDGTNVIKTSANPVTMPTVTSTGAVIPFTTLSVGMGTTCALDSSGQAYCWGWNDVGMVGDDSTVDRNTPVKVVMPGLSFVALSASAYKHFCALDSSGNAYCWGANSDGQLGDGTTTDRLKPVPVTMPPGVAFSQITVGAYHSCAMTTGTTNKHIYCWGSNFFGELGDGSTTPQLVPQLITNPTTNLVGVYAGTRHTCAVFQSGSYCWGDNSNGQLGNGQLGDGTDPYQPVTTPVAVTMPASTVFAYMSLGESHTCAVSTGSIAYCWGNNNDGQLGDDTENTDRLLPVRVVQPDGRIP